jgi:hypothetical protein
VDFHSRHASWSLRDRSDVLESLTARGLVAIRTSDKGAKHIEMAGE